MQKYKKEVVVDKPRFIEWDIYQNLNFSVDNDDIILEKIGRIKYNKKENSYFIQPIITKWQECVEALTQIKLEKEKEILNGILD